MADSLIKLIFRGNEAYITSPFGYRKSFGTSAGATSSFHNGVDYGTNCKKVPQYAIEDGYIYSCGVDYAYGGAKFVWVAYPRLGVRMLHYHLDSIKVKAGQKVTAKTVIGNTGMSGRATGIHLHLGVKRLSGGDWLDAESWYKNEYKAPAAKKKYKTGNYKVTKATVLNVRTGADTKYARKSFSQLTKDAQNKILKLSGEKCNGYVKGLTYTVSKVRGNWGKTPSGWVCLDYCERI